MFVLIEVVEGRVHGNAVHSAPNAAEAQALAVNLAVENGADRVQAREHLGKFLEWSEGSYSVYVRPIQ